MLVSLALTWLLSAADGVPGLQAALRLEQGGDDGAALAALDGLVAASPSWFLPRLEAGRLRLKSGVEMDHAEMDLDVARSLAPENPRAWYLWGLLCLERGRPAEARQALEAALELRSDYGDARARLGALLLSLGDFKAAVGALRAHAALHPEATAVRFQLAAALEGAGDVPGAESVLRELVRAPATRLGATPRLAVLLERTGRVAEAQHLRDAAAPPARVLRPLKPSAR